MGIREREAKSIAERKNTLAVKLANVAEIGAERMEEMIGNASLHDTTIATGVATRHSKFGLKKSGAQLRVSWS